MITLITGTPGAGKTALAVSMLMEEAGGRPVFVSGIPELKIDHQQTPPVEEWTVETPTPEDPNYTRPTFTFPPNSIIVIDEAQNVYRPRAATSKVPPYVAAFETHRHTGVDFWLITQHPGLIDGNIRKLVGRHVHIRNTPLGRYLFEWPEAQDPESTTARQIAARRRYTLPKRAFGQYKSASLHVKSSYRIPGAVYLLGGSILFVGFAGYYIYGRYRDVVAPSPYAVQGQSPLPGQFPPPVAPGLNGQQNGKSILTADEYVQLQNPRLAGLAHTAPVYDGVTTPKRVPVPAACLSTATRCRCYTQDATPYQIDDAMCRQLVKGGIFLPFDPEGQRDGQGRAQQRTTQASTASVGGAVVGHPVGLPEGDDYNGFAHRGPVLAFDRQFESSDRTYQESVPGESQAFAPRTPTGRRMVVQ